MPEDRPVEVDKARMSESGKGRLLVSSILCISTITVCGKAFGFLEKVVIAHFYGTTESADVYFAVMGICWSIVFFLKELTNPSLLPVFSQTLSGDRLVPDGLFRRAFLTVLSVLCVLTVLMFLGSNWIIKFLLPGFSISQQATAAGLLGALSPGMVCLGLMVVTHTCLNARKRFAISALGEAIFKIAVVVGLLSLIPMFGLRSAGVVIGFGAFCSLLFHLCYLPESRGLFRFGVGDTGKAEFKAVRNLAKPIIIGVAFSHISGLVDNSIASTLGSGQLSCLAFGKKVIDVFLLIGPIAIITVVYSQIAHLHSTGDSEVMVKLIARSTRLLLFICVPLTFLLFELRVPIVRLLFQRGQFNDVSVAMTSQSLGAYAFGLTTFALDGLFVYCFFAVRNTRTPVVLGIIFVLVDIALAILLARHFQFLGIAVAFVVSKTGKVICLGWMLRKRLGGLWGDGVSIFLLKLVLSTSILIAALKGTQSFVRTFFLEGNVFISCAFPALIGTVAFIICSYVTRMDECRTAISFVVRKMSFGEKNDRSR